jgi:hypothetical protein
MNAAQTPGPELPLAEILTRVEQRLVRLEEHAGLIPLNPAPAGFARPEGGPAETVRAAAAGDEELEFVLGQNWFASAGVLVLTCGALLTLSLPFAGLPAYAPSLIGFLLTGGLLLFARLGRKAFALVAGHFDGAALALLYFSTVRLFFFGPTPVLEIGSAGGRALLLAVVAALLAAALRRKSAWLLALGVVAGAITTVLVGAAWFVFAVNLLLAALAVYAAVRHRWPALLLLAIPAVYCSHLFWALDRPWLGRDVHLVQ